MMCIIADHKLIAKVKITMLKNRMIFCPFLDTVHSKSLKLSGHMKRSNTGLTKLCFESMVPGKKNVEESQNRGGGIILWSSTNE